jgi:hypothetical protein
VATKRKKKAKQRRMSLRDQLAFNRLADMCARIEREVAEIRSKQK